MSAEALQRQYRGCDGGGVKPFRDPQVKEGKAETTANLAPKTLRSLFNDARRKGLISTKPTEAVKTFGPDTISRISQNTPHQNALRSAGVVRNRVRMPCLGLGKILHDLLFT